MTIKVVNTPENNAQAPIVIGAIADWHHARNLIEGATTWTQSKKYLEEFLELVAAQMPEHTPEVIAGQVHKWIEDLLVAGRIKTVKVENAKAALHDAIGDMGVVGINISEREGSTYTQDLQGSYREIEHRTGRMVDGCFVKDEDL